VLSVVKTILESVIWGSEAILVVASWTTYLETARMPDRESHDARPQSQATSAPPPATHPAPPQGALSSTAVG